jgi:hypothetical protein
MLINFESDSDALRKHLEADVGRSQGDESWRREGMRKIWEMPWLLTLKLQGFRVAAVVGFFYCLRLQTEKEVIT